MRALSQRERRLAAGAFLAGAIVLCWRFVAWPLIDGYLQRRDDRQVLTAEYARNDHVLAGLPGWRKEAQDQAATAASYALTAPNETVAVELVAQRIARDAKAAGAPAPTTQSVTDKPVAGWVHVHSDMQLTVGQLYAVLTQIQNEEPYVVVGYLSIEARPNSNPDEPQILDIRTDIFAPVRTASPAAAARTSARRG
jgi:hypothetical protein